jgi:hypothetical protein
MQDLYARSEEYSPDGTCLKRETKVGGIVVWGVVVIVLCFSGHSILTVPTSLLSLWRWRGGS